MCYARYESTFVHETAAEEAEKEKKDENPEGVAKAVRSRIRKIKNRRKRNEEMPNPEKLVVQRIYSQR